MRSQTASIAGALQASSPSELSPQLTSRDAGPRMKIALTINGNPHDVDVDPSLLLVQLIRDEGFTGTNIGCLNGDCGACTVKLDGLIVKSCLRLAASSDGCNVVT